MKQYTMHVQHVCLSVLTATATLSVSSLLTIDSVPCNVFHTCRTVGREARRPAYKRPKSDTLRSDITSLLKKRSRLGGAMTTTVDVHRGDDQMM